MAGKILIYDGIAANRIVLRCKISAACYDVIQADSYDDLARKARTERPDLVICDLDQSPKQALALCRSLCGTPLTTVVPVVLTATAPSPALRIAACQAGAWTLMEKPLQDDLLLAGLRRLLRQSNGLAEMRSRHASAAELGLAEPAAGFAPAIGRIAVVSENDLTGRDRADGLRARLAGSRIEALTPQQALSQGAEDPAPEAFVILATTDTWPHVLRLLCDLGSRAATQHSRLVVVLDSPGDDTPGGRAEAATRLAMALDLGADDVLQGEVHGAELALRLKAQIARKRAADEMRRVLHSGVEMAVRDPLTNLYNRRYAMPRLGRMLRAAQESGRPFALMALDLDRFKSVNDTYGHAAGDAVLVEVAQRLSSALRPRDLVARSGGEEFWVALQDTDGSAAAATAQALRRLIRANPIALPDRRGMIRVTMSIGVAVYTPTGGVVCPEGQIIPAQGGPAMPERIEYLLGRADAALFAAKTDGRDKVTFAPHAA